jgi:hypothetical protein
MDAAEDYARRWIKREVDDISIGFWKCLNNVVFLGFRFIRRKIL